MVQSQTEKFKNCHGVIYGILDNYIFIQTNDKSNEILLKKTELV